MIVTRSGTRPDTVRKEAGSIAERDRLKREGQVLAAARHPGVVELMAVEPDRDQPEALVLRAVEGAQLADTGRRPPAEVAALGSAIAMVLADLHDIGVVHGQVAPSHVLLDGDGRPVLCGLGRGRCPGQPDGPTPADDVAALAAMLMSWLTPGATGRLPNVLAEAGRARAARRPTARRLARILGEVAAGEPRRGPSWRRSQVIVAAAAAALTLAIGVVRASRSSGPHLVTPSGIFITSTGRYRVGVPGDQVVVGRWRCAGGPDATPAVLRPSTGEVWAFDNVRSFDTFGLKPARVLDPRLVATVPGARALRVAAVAAGCDRLVVLRSSGPPVTLAV